MTTVSEYQAKVEKDVVNMDRYNVFINGPVGGTVTTDSGSFKNLATLARDSEIAGDNETSAIIASAIFTDADAVAAPIADNPNELFAMNMDADDGSEFTLFVIADNTDTPFLTTPDVSRRRIDVAAGALVKGQVVTLAYSAADGFYKLLGSRDLRIIRLENAVDVLQETIPDLVRVEDFSQTTTDLQTSIGTVNTRAVTAEHDLQVVPDRTNRPGDNPNAYTISSAGGDTSELPRLGPDDIVVSATGNVRRCYGSSFTAGLKRMAMTPTGIYRATFIVQRITNVSNVAVNMGVLFFDLYHASLPEFGIQLFAPADITREQEARTFTATVSRTAQAGVTFVVPAATRYIADFVSTLGGEVSLDIVESGLLDVTDLSSQNARLDNTGVRIDQGEQSEASRAAALGSASVTATTVRSVLSWSPDIPASAGFTGFSISDTSGTQGQTDGAALYLSVPGSVVGFDVLVVSRSGTFTASDAPGTLDGDIVHDVAPFVVFQQSAPPATAHYTAEEVSLVDVQFRKPLARLPTRNYFCLVRARNAAGNPTAVGRVGSDRTGLSVPARGWLYTSAGVVNALTGTADATAGFFYRRQAASRTTSGFIRMDGQPVASGLVFDGRGLTVVDLNGSRPLFGGYHAVPACSTGTYTHNSFNMQQGAVGDYLRHSNVSNVTVKLAGTSTVLTPETDYHIDPSGRLYGTGHASALVDVSYSGAGERYDLIVEEPENGRTVLISGAERVYTAGEDMYRAGTTDPQQRPLYWVRVVGNAIAEVLPAWDWIGTTSLAHHAEIEAHLSVARRSLGRIRRKLMRGDGIIVAGYGDSNTQCGGGAYVSPERSFPPNRNFSDGATDLPGFGGGFYDTADSEADYRTAFVADQNANRPPVTMNGLARYRTGPNWYMLEALQAAYGHTFIADRNPVAGEITYLNFGIGATTAETTAGNMGDPARLAATIDPSAYGFRKPDLVVLQVGMNGTPDPLFPQQVDRILAAFMGAGIDVLVYGMHLTNIETPLSAANRFTLQAWRTINAQIRRVALARGAAYVPTDMFQGPGFEGYMGLGPNGMTRTNYLNHPGPRERMKIGKILPLPLLP